MPRHLICDAHEWINEVLTVPIYHLAKLQLRERAEIKTAGQEDPFEFDSRLDSLLDAGGAVIGGSDRGTPPVTPMRDHYSGCQGA